MARIPIAQRLADIEAQGQAVKRRIEKMQADHDFLADVLLSRPVADMSAQRRLLEEWNEEIERMRLDLQFLRDEWKRLDRIKNKSSLNKVKL